MNKNLSKTILAILLFFIAMISFYSVGKAQDCTGNDCSKYSWLGWGGMVFIIIIMIYYFFSNRTKKKIPFSKIKRTYIELMEENEKLSINPLAETYQLTEEGNRYVFVLRQLVDDDYDYYMCEADMYTAEMGRGFGTHTDKEAEAMYWYTTRKKIDISTMVANELKRQAARDVFLKGRVQEASLKKYEGEFQ